MTQKEDRHRPPDLEPNQWYWVRRDDGSLAPYRFHGTHAADCSLMGEFYVGSIIQTFPLSRVEGRAQMPDQTWRS